ncbi:hypothetical protein Bhyg_16851, partial [Pseudolycoriella hygida]
MSRNYLCGLIREQRYAHPVNSKVYPAQNQVGRIPVTAIGSTPNDKSNIFVNSLDLPISSLHYK